MSRTLVTAALALLAAGCTTLDLDETWSKPGTTIAQTSRDDWSCRREVDERAERTEEQYVGGLVDVARFIVEERNRDATYERCMTARGYARTETTKNPVSRLMRN